MRAWHAPSASRLQSMRPAASSRLHVGLAGIWPAASVGFNGSTGALKIDSAGSLRLTQALVIGKNTVLLKGSASTLTDSVGLSLAGGTITGPLVRDWRCRSVGRISDARVDDTYYLGTRPLVSC
jgi:hypothetical protein